MTVYYDDDDIVAALRKALAEAESEEVEVTRRVGRLARALMVLEDRDPPPLNGTTARVPARLAELVECDECGDEFTRRGLATHKGRMHPKHGTLVRPAGDINGGDSTSDVASPPRASRPVTRAEWLGNTARDDQMAANAAELVEGARTDAPDAGSSEPTHGQDRGPSLETDRGPLDIVVAEEHAAAPLTTVDDFPLVPDDHGGLTILCKPCHDGDHAACLVGECECEDPHDGIIDDPSPGSADDDDGMEWGHGGVRPGKPTVDDRGPNL